MRLILDLFKAAYKKQTGKNLKVFCVPNENLRDYHTVKGDVKKGLDRMPKNSFLVAADESPEEETKSPAMQADRQRRQTLWSHNKEQVCLEDFHVKKVLGKGSFGKVFLVQKKGDTEYYAMKSIRKDILIQND